MRQKVKRIWQLRLLLILITYHLSLITLLSSCGPDRGFFRLEGEFRGFNQGEFYVYSTDGGLRRPDTIGVKGGRFTCTKENDLLTGFRLKVSEMTPPETVREAADFITKHPDALSSTFLLNKYFVQSQTPDYKKALSLAKTIHEARPGNKRIAALVKHLEGLQAIRNGATLPKFTATDIKGRPISSGDLYAPVNVITTWATWNYESQNIQRQLKRREKEKGVNRLRILSICLDANAKECRRLMDRDSITWCNICDERMWDNPILTTLGLSRIPDNIITDSQGRILAHSLPVAELNKKIDELLK